MSDAPLFAPAATQDPLVCNGAALRKATRRVSQLYDTVLAPCGLKVSQHSILVHIARAGTPSMTDLARAMVLDRSALAHNLKPLQRDGYVRMTRDPLDGRSRRVELTETGRAKLVESRRLWKDAQSRFEAAYGAQRAADLRRSLADIFSDEFALAFSRG
ncbi:MarR family transcriptional regulator [Achromobacter sp. Root83]|uniref:MarR family winged helix-turn-helix transcriptional regulator n=1 Tax=Achromobacter sp. Root83 TaxID=1736602 RepID=UPI0007089F02|nr:MarR family winged helix-turn-helix transcriptional regulator [Achromobacter sp. Root83]KRC78567.1 MarR family transcriptional regulator [Achromobacter sp. Root83]